VERHYLDASGQRILRLPAIRFYFSLFLSLFLSLLQGATALLPRRHLSVEVSEKVWRLTKNDARRVSVLEYGYDTDTFTGVSNVFLRLARMNLGKKQHFVGGITTSPDERGSAGDGGTFLGAE
jgi:hypothetical protein